MVLGLQSCFVYYWISKEAIHESLCGSFCKILADCFSIHLRPIVIDLLKYWVRNIDILSLLESSVDDQCLPMEEMHYLFKSLPDYFNKHNHNSLSGHQEMFNVENTQVVLCLFTEH